MLFRLINQISFDGSHWFLFRFIPSTCIYLMTIIPVVWLLELAMFDFRVKIKARMNVQKCPVNLEDYIKDPGENETTILLVSNFTTDSEEVGISNECISRRAVICDVSMTFFL